MALFGGLWTAGVALTILRQTTLPRWLGYSGLIAAASVLVSLIELYGISAGPMLTVSGSLWQFWLITLGGMLLRHKSKA